MDSLLTLLVAQVVYSWSHRSRHACAAAALATFAAGWRWGKQMEWDQYGSVGRSPRGPWSSIVSGSGDIGSFHHDILTAWEAKCDGATMHVFQEPRRRSRCSKIAVSFQFPSALIQSIDVYWCGVSAMRGEASGVPESFEQLCHQLLPAQDFYDFWQAVWAVWGCMGSIPNYWSIMIYLISL